MTKTSRSNDDEEKSMKESIQRRFDNMFSGKNQPLANVSIQEVDALKSRVAALEAELAEIESAGKPNAPALPSTKAALNLATPTASPSRDQFLVGDAVTDQGKRKSLSRTILDFFRLPEDQDPSFIRVVRSILIFALLANLGALFLTVGIVNSKINIPTIATLSVLLVFITGSLILSYQKKILPAKIIVVPALITAITYIAIGANGLHDSSIAGYGLTIVIASLILGRRGILLASGLVVLGVVTVGYSDMAGITESFMAAKTGIDDILIIAMLLVTSGGVLRILVKRLGESTQKAMAANKELRAFQVGLEQRVADRTHDLELATEVGRTVAAKVDSLYELLSQAVELIRTRFDLYYAQIYLTDPSGERITLYAGTGDVGQQLVQQRHYLQVNSSSLNGQAVLEKKPIIIIDAQQSPNFNPNHLLPLTRSEMAVPLVVGDKVIGVLDVQSERPGTLSKSNLPAFQALAGQLAIAIQNAVLFAEVREARYEVEAQIRRLTEEGWHDFLNAIDRGEKIGYAFRQSEIVRLQPDASAEKDRAVRLPLSVTGTKIGEIYLPIQPDQSWTDNELELIRATGAQLAQHIENLRLLAQAERYRTEAEQALQRLTHEGWDAFLQSHNKLEPGYVFDLTEVRPLSAKSNGHSDHAVKHPMAVGNQVIGELVVDVPDQSEEAAEVIAAVADQLSGHIENLRLSELNEQHAQRERTLRQITSALRSSNNPATIMRTAVRELGSILGRRTVVQLAKPQADPARSGSGTETESNAPAYQS